MNKPQTRPAANNQPTELHASLNEHQRQAVCDYFAEQQPAELDAAASQQQWQQIQQRIQSSQRTNVRLGGWAAAALLVLSFGFAFQLDLLPSDSAVPGSDSLAISPALNSQDGQAETLNPLVQPSHGGAVANTEQAHYELAALRGMSSQLEQEWQQIRQRPRAVTGAEVERQQQLTGLIASVDARLTAVPDNPSRQRQLWRQRVVLMNELVAGGVQAEPAVWTL